MMLLMEKIFALLFVLISFTNLSHAAPVYGTRMPAKGKFYGGVQTHAVFDKKLEGIHGEMATTQHFIMLSYGLTDWLSIDLKAGVGNIRQHPDAGEKLGYASRFAGGYGFRIKAYEKNDVRAVVGFQHISVHPWEDWTGGNKYQAIVDDWQASAVVSYDLGRMTPYAGLKAGRMDYTYWVDEDERNRVKSDETRMIGLALGIDVDISQDIWLNVEAQVGDVEALVAGINVKF